MLSTDRYAAFPDANFPYPPFDYRVKLNINFCGLQRERRAFQKRDRIILIDVFLQIVASNLSDLKSDKNLSCSEAGSRRP